MTTALILDIVFLLTLLSGVLITLIGAIGLVRLPTFYQRLHAPAIISTFGLAAVSVAACVHLYQTTGVLSLHFLLIIFFIFLSAPVVSMLIARAGLYRDINRGTPELHQEGIMSEKHTAEK